MREGLSEAEAIRSTACFTDSQGVRRSGFPWLHSELWRFRRRGFQDCWVAFFFLFAVVITLLVCSQEISSFVLTPHMRRAMESSWGPCDTDFALHHVQRREALHLPRAEGSVVHLNRTAAEVSVLAAHTVFHGFEALVVGIDYMLCNRKGHPTDLEAGAATAAPVITPPPAASGASKEKSDSHPRRFSSRSSSAIRNHYNINSNSYDDDDQNLELFLLEMSWSLDAFEWKPIAICEFFLFASIPLSWLALILLARFKEKVLLVVVHAAVLALLAGSVLVWVHSHLFLIAFSMIGVAALIIWWWALYGAVRQPVAASLLRCASTIFTRHYDHRFFIFSTITSLILIVINLSFVMLALLPPFIRLVSGKYTQPYRDASYVLLMALTDYWLLTVMQTMLEYIAAGAVLVVYYAGCSRPPATPLKEFTKAAISSHWGGICIHAFCHLPVALLYRVVSLCTICLPRVSLLRRLSSAVASLRHHFHRYAIIHVVLYGCPYDEAAQHTWALLREPPPVEEEEEDHFLGDEIGMEPSAAAHRPHLNWGPGGSKQGDIPLPLSHQRIVEHSNRCAAPLLLQNHSPHHTNTTSRSSSAGDAASPTPMSVRLTSHYAFAHLLSLHMRSTTVHLAVFTTSVIVATVNAVMAWGLLRLYLSDDEGFSLRLNTPSSDHSSLMVGLVIFLATYAVVSQYLVVFTVTADVLALSVVECLSGLVLSLPLVFEEVCEATASKGSSGGVMEVSGGDDAKRTQREDQIDQLGSTGGIARSYGSTS